MESILHRRTPATWARCDDAFSTAATSPCYGFICARMVARCFCLLSTRMCISSESSLVVGYFSWLRERGNIGCTIRRLHHSAFASQHSRRGEVELAPSVAMEVNVTATKFFQCGELSSMPPWYALARCVSVSTNRNASDSIVMDRASIALARANSRASAWVINGRAIFG